MQPRGNLLRQTFMKALEIIREFEVKAIDPNHSVIILKWGHHLQPRGKKCWGLREKVFNALQHAFVIENGAASKTEEVFALSRVELATDVVDKVLEDLDVEGEHINRGG